jgi:hypothetical protein
MSEQLGPWSSNVSDDGTLSYRQDTPGLGGGSVERTGGRFLVWSDLGRDELVFIEKGLATDLARVWDAVNHSATVAEALAAMPVAYRERLLDRIRPGDPDEYDVEWLSDFVSENEDLIEWPQQQMLGLLPADVQDKYGTRSFSATTGPCLVLNPGDADRIVAALEATGFICHRDDELCQRASGLA